MSDSHIQFHTKIQGLTIKFQDWASKTGKKVSKKIINFFYSKYISFESKQRGVRAYKPLLEVRLWSSLQNSGYIPFNGRNILESLSFDE